MSHAVVINVNLPEQSEENLTMLNEVVIPQSRSQAGFESGTWLNDHGHGMGVVLFDTEQHAQAAMANLRPPDGMPTTFVSSSVFDVAGQAHV